jgi:hypothetical protein
MTPLVALAVMAFALASCGGDGSASKTTRAQQDGTAVGVYGIEGGPAPGLFHPFSNGGVTLKNDKRVYSTHIASDGHFRLNAVTGTYSVTGFTNSVGTGTCGRATVIVQANETASARVVCQIPWLGAGHATLTQGLPVQSQMSL